MQFKPEDYGYSTAMRKHKYPSRGICPFCLQLPSEDVKLVHSHMIPEALGGLLSIDDGACSKCEEEANKCYEQKVIRGEFNFIRLLLKLKRKKPNKPTTPLTKVGIGNQPEVFKAIEPTPAPTKEELEAFFCAELGLRERPPIVSIQSLKLPAGKLVGIERSGDLNGVSTKSYYFKFPFNVPHRIITVQNVHHHTEVGLMLAKIAYQYAFAELGLGGFDGSEIRDLLKFKRYDLYNFVGSYKGTARLKTTDLHYLALKKHKNIVSVILNLFANNVQLTAEVYVGKIIR